MYDSSIVQTLGLDVLWWRKGYIDILCSREEVRTANIIAYETEGVDCLCLDR